MHREGRPTAKQRCDTHASTIPVADSGWVETCGMVLPRRMHAIVLAIIIPFVSRGGRLQLIKHIYCVVTRNHPYHSYVSCHHHTFKSPYIVDFATFPFDACVQYDRVSCRFVGYYKGYQDMTILMNSNIANDRGHHFWWSQKRTFPLPEYDGWNGQSPNW